MSLTVHFNLRYVQQINLSDKITFVYMHRSNAIKISNILFMKKKKKKPKKTHNIIHIQ